MPGVAIQLTELTSLEDNFHADVNTKTLLVGSEARLFLVCMTHSPGIR